MKAIITNLMKNMQVRNLSYKRIRTWYSGLVKSKPREPPYEHLVQIGDPCLRTASDIVPDDCIKSPEIDFLLKTMTKTFKQYDCVGLSAPQIGINLRIIMLQFSSKHAKAYSLEDQKIREMSLLPFTIVINPEMKITDYTKIIFPEACGSVKGFVADVSRYRSLQLSGFSREGEPIMIDTVGWNARIVQHEMDHLNGKVYTDIMDRKTLTCSCWQEINSSGGKVELPYGVF